MQVLRKNENGRKPADESLDCDPSGNLAYESVSLSKPHAMIMIERVFFEGIAGFRRSCGLPLQSDW